MLKYVVVTSLKVLTNWRGGRRVFLAYYHLQHFSKPADTRGIVRQRIAGVSMHPLGVFSLATWLNIRMFKEVNSCYSREWLYAQKMDTQQKTGYTLLNLYIHVYDLRT